MSNGFVTVDLRQTIALEKRMMLLPGQIDTVMQFSVRKVAQHVQEAEVKEMKRAFHNPTRFTLNAFRIVFDKKAITATVEVKDGYWTRSQNYLSTQIDGGKRRFKAFENALSAVGVLPGGWMAVPGEGADMDDYGNMRVGQIRQILSWFDAAERVAGSTQNMGEKGRNKKRRGTRRQRPFEYFSAQPGFRMGRGSWINGRNQNLAPGIYKRTYFSWGSAIKPVLILVRNANYKPLFKFDDVAHKTIARVAPSALERYLQKELRKL